MDARRIPARPDLEQYKKQAKELVRAWNGDDKPLQKIPGLHNVQLTLEEFRDRIRQRIYRLARKKIEGDEFTLTDAQFLLAREHAFESWPKFAKFIDDINRENSAAAKFELAAEAVINGDVKTLERLLKDDPELVHRRSDREHRSTLLHYISANGIEDFRQQTPQNILEITKILLDAGAEINAESDVYGGGSTALGLAATSVHPQRAGVQNKLLELLLDSGADLEQPGNTHGAVRGSLANGCFEAAEFLARRGAKLDLVGAAGIGRVDAVKDLLSKEDVPQSVVEEALRFAAGYGQDNVVEYLLNSGADIQCVDADKQTPLHWATFSPQIETMKLLIARGARLDAVNVYGGDVLGQTWWNLTNNDNAADFVPAIETLLDAGAKIEDGTLEWLRRQPKPSDEIKSRVGEVLRRFGAK